MVAANWGVELFAALPFTHGITFNGAGEVVRPPRYVRWRTNYRALWPDSSPEQIEARQTPRKPRSDSGMPLMQ